MRMISHFNQKVRLDGASVGLRFYSLECELAAMRGVRIPQVAVSVCPPDADEPVVESVDADPDLARRFEVSAPSDLRPLLDLLCARFHGQPIGELAGRAARLLAPVN